MKQNVLNTDLSGKVAVVTGAGGVLCSAFAKVLARAGAKVALLDRNFEAANGFAAEINEEGGFAKAYACDVLDKDVCYAVADQVLSDLGPCDILLNGAGGNNPRATTDKEYFYPEDLMNDEIRTFYNLDEHGIEFVFSLNFMGTLIPTRVFSKDMIGREGCNILNVSSMNAFTPLTKIPAYSAAKAAVSNFTQWLAVHFSKVGIRVNAIAPGFFLTNQTRPLYFREDGSVIPRYNKIIDATPMGRFGEPEELIGGLLFLLNNEAASFITGTVLTIDGGYNCYSGV